MNGTQWPVEEEEGEEGEKSGQSAIAGALV